MSEANPEAKPDPRGLAIAVVSRLHNAEWLLDHFGLRMGSTKITRPYDLNGAYLLAVSLRHHSTGRLTKTGRYLFDERTGAEMSPEQIAAAIAADLLKPPQIEGSTQPITPTEPAPRASSVETSQGITPALIERAIKVVDSSDLGSDHKSLLCMLLRRLLCYETVDLASRTKKIEQDHERFSRGVFMQLAGIFPHLRLWARAIVTLHEQRGHLLLMVRVLQQAVMELGKETNPEAQAKGRPDAPV